MPPRACCLHTTYASLQTSGAGTSAGLAAALATATRTNPLQLAPGSVYLLDAPIDIAYAPYIVSDPDNPATLRAAWTPVSTALADSSANFILRAKGAVSGPSLTLTSATKKDNKVLNLSSAATIAAGDWMLVSGSNAGDDGALHSATAMTLEELFCAKSIAVNAVTVTAPAAQHHASGVSVREIAPILDALIVGIRFDGSNTNCAVGLQLEYAFAPTIRIVGTNLSRAVWGAVGCKQMDNWHVHEEGNSNCAAFFESCQRATGSITTDERGARRNTLGQARGMLTMRRRCDTIVLQNFAIRHRCCAVNIDGGTGNSIRNGVIADVDWTDRVADDAECIRTGGLTGTALSGAILVNSVQLPTDQYLHDYTFALEIDGVRLEDCRQTDDTHWQAALVLVDQYRTQLGRVSIVAGGESSWNGTRIANGLAIYDAASATIDNLSISSAKYAITTINSGGYVDIAHLSVMWFDEQTNGYAVFYLADDGAGQIHVGSCVWESLDGYLVLPAGGWNDVGRRSLVIDTLTIQNVNRIYDECFLCKNVSGVAFDEGEIGEIYEIAAAGPVPALRGVRTPTTTDAADKVVVIRDQGSQWVLCARGPRRIIKTAAAAAIGDWLAIDLGGGTPRIAKIDATKTLPCLGIALEKTAGAGVVRAG